MSAVNAAAASLGGERAIDDRPHVGQRVIEVEAAVELGAREQGGELRIGGEQLAEAALTGERAHGGALHDHVGGLARPSALHQRTPLVIGSRLDVGFVADTLRRSAARASGPVVQPAL